jgi:hypothetical protein
LPAQPLLTNIVNSLSGTPTSVTPQQSGAIGTLTNATNAIPNFTTGATNTTDKLFGYNTNPQQDISTNALTGLNTTLSPYLSSSYLNPMNTPGLSTELSGLTNSISNSINSQFAAAGRDLSPANTTALAYGLEQGEAPVIANQYNQNVAAQQGAANSVFGAGNTTAQQLTQEQLAALGINTSGINAATSVPGVATAPGGAQLDVANTGAQMPFQNLGWLSSLADPLGALGGQTSATGTSTSTLPWYSGISGLGGGTGLANLGSFLGIGSIFSDAHVKEDIAPVGMLYDTTPIYSYRYIKEIDPTQKKHIGVMAQDVEKRRPDAVHEIGGVKAVDYGAATERSRYLGMLAELDMAA